VAHTDLLRQFPRLGQFGARQRRRVGGDGDGAIAECLPQACSSAVESTPPENATTAPGIARNACCRCASFCSYGRLAVAGIIAAPF
jgi:hypothetical protein